MGIRNPFAKELRVNSALKPKVAKSDSERQQQRDKWHRSAKYKASNLDDHDDIGDVQIGDEVEVDIENPKTGKIERKTGMVKNPNAPLGMIGITVNGQYALVPEDQATIISESLNRMKELSK